MNKNILILLGCILFCSINLNAQNKAYKKALKAYIVKNDSTLISAATNIVRQITPNLTRSLYKQHDIPKTLIDKYESTLVRYCENKYINDYMLNDIIDLYAPYYLSQNVTTEELKLSTNTNITPSDSIYKKLEKASISINNDSQNFTTNFYNKYQERLLDMISTEIDREQAYQNNGYTMKNVRRRGF